MTDTELLIKHYQDRIAAIVKVNEQNKALRVENERYRKALEKVASMERYTFAECSDAEFVMDTVRQALEGNDG